MTPVRLMLMFAFVMATGPAGIMLLVILAVPFYFVRRMARLEREEMAWVERERRARDLRIKNYSALP